MSAKKVILATAFYWFKFSSKLKANNGDLFFSLLYLTVKSLYFTYFLLLLLLCLYCGKNSGCCYTISPWVISNSSRCDWVVWLIFPNTWFQIHSKLCAFDLSKIKLISMAIDTMSFIITPSKFINNNNNQNLHHS